MSHEQTTAVIYCRVSSRKQVLEGGGLPSQETRCREYARFRGYDIVKVFADDLSGGLTSRPGMKAMLKFLKAQKRLHVVIIDDITRLARDVKAHIELRESIARVGGVLESPSITFGDDSDSIFHENILAAASQHQRQKNAEQTRNRMRARALQGYWPLSCPVGYKYAKAEIGGKKLVVDEPAASVVRQAMEGFAVGLLASRAEVQRFLQASPHFPKDYRGQVTHERAYQILTQPLYAGYLEVPSWKINLRKAQHEGLISYETFMRVQSLLNATSRVPNRRCGGRVPAAWLCKLRGLQSSADREFQQGCDEVVRVLYLPW